MIFRLFFALAGVAMMLAGYNMVEVQASLMEFGRARESIIDMGLFLIVIGFVSLVLPVERKS